MRKSVAPSAVPPVLAVAAVVGLLLTSACSDKEFDPPDREAQVSQAEREYSASLFDTIQWESGEERALRGSSVYASECRDCHGTVGRGGTEYAAERDLDVPSLVEPEWEYAGDLDRVRRAIYVGHPSGMPIWGVAGISGREIDAVAYYVVEQLRPEILGEGGGGG